MRFTIEDLDVFFPYDYVYKEQYEYMLQLKHALVLNGQALLEMPTVSKNIDYFRFTTKRLGNREDRLLAITDNII